MLRKLYLVPVLALLALPALAQAQFEAGNWATEFSLSGTAQKDFETFQANIDSQLNYFVSKEISIGMGNTLQISDGGSLRDGSIRFILDYNFDMDRWVPYVGGNIGYAYGDQIEDAWIAGPEAGVRYFVNSTTYFHGRLAYEFSLNEGFDFGAWFYGVGIGFKW